MQDQGPHEGTLSVHRAFVVHLTAAVGARRRRFAGRAEHLSTGEVVRFSSLKDLLAFFVRVVADQRLGLRPGPAATRDRQ